MVPQRSRVLRNYLQAESRRRPDEPQVERHYRFGIDRESEREMQRSARPLSGSFTKSFTKALASR